MAIPSTFRLFWSITGSGPETSGRRRMGSLALPGFQTCNKLRVRCQAMVIGYKPILERAVSARMVDDDAPPIQEREQEAEQRMKCDVAWDSPADPLVLRRYLKCFSVLAGSVVIVIEESSKEPGMLLVAGRQDRQTIQDR
jgi:hypothetical protein